MVNTKDTVSVGDAVFSGSQICSSTSHWPFKQRQNLSYMIDVLLWN